MFAKCWVIFWVSFVFMPWVMGQDHWPRFRGTHGSGIAQNQNLPETWDAETGKGIAWKIAIPGLSHASPIVWHDTVFMVTVQRLESKRTPGTGSVSINPPTDNSEVWAIQLKTGEMLWRKTAHSAPINPDKGNFVMTAHATPATDGKVVVAMFGSQGIHAFDMMGKKLWHKNLGLLGLGDFEGDSAGWAHASSPIIHQGLVFLQCDTPEADFLVALDNQTGSEVWRTAREEVRSYGTPTWIPGSPNEIVANGANFICGYEAATGKELWRLAGSSKEDTTPTPIFNKDLILVTNGKRNVKPIYAIRRGARGTLTLSEGQTSSKDILWSSKGLGPYLPTPIIVEDLLYSVNDKGILTCFEIATGAQVYRERTTVGGGVFTASLVAADGNLYLTKMQGDILVVPTGRNFKVTAVNKMGEDLVATPAFAKGTMLIRSKNYLFAVRKEQ